MFACLFLCIVNYCFFDLTFDFFFLILVFCSFSWWLMVAMVSCDNWQLAMLALFGCVCVTGVAGACEMGWL